jgi:hypothetical protein
MGAAGLAFQLTEPGSSLRWPHASSNAALHQSVLAILATPAGSRRGSSLGIAATAARPVAECGSLRDSLARPAHQGRCSDSPNSCPRLVVSVGRLNGAKHQGLHPLPERS